MPKKKRYIIIVDSEGLEEHHLEEALLAPHPSWIKAVKIDVVSITGLIDRKPSEEA